MADAASSQQAYLELPRYASREHSVIATTVRRASPSRYSGSFGPSWTSIMAFCSIVGMFTLARRRQMPMRVGRQLRDIGGAARGRRRYRTFLRGRLSHG